MGPLDDMSDEELDDLLDLPEWGGQFAGKIMPHAA